ncbi:unnamed protein product [Heligmosomoides polygyrus]|uniref:Uncharacterized protein n=1 Tax=Heligmosomoides polygyrus TaxID=6339 RepID=A0A183FSD3_HELPZ|nr:unnamed protein product [Heligmosomoides polygyrus]
MTTNEVNVRRLQGTSQTFEAAFCPEDSGGGRRRSAIETGRRIHWQIPRVLPSLATEQPPTTGINIVAPAINHSGLTAKATRLGRL